MNELEKTLAKIYKNRIIRFIVILFFVLSGLFALLNSSFDFLSKIKKQHTDSNNVENGTNLIDTTNVKRKETMFVDETKNLTVKNNNEPKLNQNSPKNKKTIPEIVVSTIGYDTIDYSENGFTIGEIYLTIRLNKIPFKIEIFWNTDVEESIIVPDSGYKILSALYVYSISHKYKTIGEKNIKIEVTYSKGSVPTKYCKKIQIKNLKL